MKKQNNHRKDSSNKYEERRKVNNHSVNDNSGNTIKDPEDWKTGDEPITGAQRSYLNTLASEAGEEVNSNLTKADAAKKIEELQEKTGRGRE
ncbi:MAG TPA: DUF3072 domain-containing protein [Flavisolibacter sp.]|nr:DUF3072 domain-containing protein [Flavisolibacter sp.]